MAQQRLQCGCVVHTESDDYVWFEQCFRHERDCDRLGLTDDQRATLTGFSGRAVRALAHLREAWCGADTQNAASVAQAIYELMKCHSLKDIPSLCSRVLANGLDAHRTDQLMDAIRTRLTRL